MEDILDEPKLEAAGAETAWIYIRLLAMLNRTKSSTGKIELSPNGLCFLTGKKRIDRARQAIDKACVNGLLTVRYCAVNAVVRVPKWAESQGLASVPTPTPTPTPSHGDDGEEKLTDIQVKKLRDGENLTDIQVKKLRDMAPLSLAGSDYSDADIRCWFAWVQPKMRAMGRKSYWRTALYWWPNVRADELTKAVRWVRACAYGEQSVGVALVPEPRQEEDSFDDFRDAFQKTDRHLEGVRHGNNGG
jgi:hypothetical protein